jgi:hypothetical protein
VDAGFLYCIRNVLENKNEHPVDIRIPVKFSWLSTYFPFRE